MINRKRISEVQILIKKADRLMLKCRPKPAKNDVNSAFFMAHGAIRAARQALEALKGKLAPTITHRNIARAKSSIVADDPRYDMDCDEIYGSKPDDEGDEDEQVAPD